MKTKHLLFGLLTMFFVLSSVNTLYGQDKKKNQETVTFYVEDMHCQNCQSKIEKNIAFEKGVTDIQCDLDNKLVTITYKADKTNPENIVKGFEKIKYKAEVYTPESADSQQTKDAE